MFLPHADEVFITLTWLCHIVYYVGIGHSLNMDMSNFLGMVLSDHTVYNILLCMVLSDHTVYIFSFSTKVLRHSLNITTDLHSTHPEHSLFTILIETV